MAMCVIAVAAVAPCQCFSPGGNQTTSPGRISSTGPPSRCAHPQPLITIRVWPSGCVCHAVRAPGSNVTLAPLTRVWAARPRAGVVDRHVCRLQHRVAEEAEVVEVLVLELLLLLLVGRDPLEPA